MTFTVTYRGADGALRTEAVEAASRGECLAQMKARGVSVQSVKARAGKRASHGGAKREPIAGAGRNRHAVAWILSVACVLLAGGIGWYWLNGRHGGEATLQADGPKKPSAFAKEVKPAAAPKVEVVEPVTSHTNMPTRKASLKELTPEERDAVIAQKILDSPPDLTPSTNRAFRTGVEQVASWIFTTRLGDAPPPLPKIGIRDEAHIRAILDAPNLIFDTDSEKVAEAKRIVTEVKKVLDEYLSKGGNVQEFFEYYHGQLRESHSIWRQSQLNMLKVLREEPEAAPALVAEMNAELAERGIKPLMVPPKYRKLIEMEK